MDPEKAALVFEEVPQLFLLFVTAKNVDLVLLVIGIVEDQAVVGEVQYSIHKLRLVAAQCDERLFSVLLDQAVKAETCGEPTVNSGLQMLERWYGYADIGERTCVFGVRLGFLVGVYSILKVTNYGSQPFCAQIRHKLIYLLEGFVEFVVPLRY